MPPDFSNSVSSGWSAHPAPYLLLTGTGPLVAPCSGKRLWARSAHKLATDQSKATFGPRVAHAWDSGGPLGSQVRKAIPN